MNGMIATVNGGLQRDYWEKEHGFRCFDHPVVKFFAEQRLAFVNRFINLAQVTSVLDVGCGSGFSSYYYGQYVPEVWGVDRSETMLSQNPLPPEKLIQADVMDLPFERNTFNLVNSWEVLHHVENPHEALMEMYRVSKEFVVLFEPNRYNPALIGLALIDRSHRWVLKYSMSFMKKLVEAADLEIISSDVVGCIFPNKIPASLLSVLKYVPFRIPLIGISNAVICRKRK